MTEQTKQVTSQFGFIGTQGQLANALDEVGNRGTATMEAVCKTAAAVLRKLTPLPVKSSAGVQCISYNGTIIIVHPDFPPHMWDAEAKKMRRLGLEAVRSVEL